MERNRVSCKKKKKLNPVIPPLALQCPSLISPPPDAVHGLGKVLRYVPPGTAGVVLLLRYVVVASWHSFAEHCFHTF